MTWGALEGRLRMFSTEELESLDRSYFSVICADAYDVTIMLNIILLGSHQFPA